MTTQEYGTLQDYLESVILDTYAEAKALVLSVAPLALRMSVEILFVDFADLAVVSTKETS